MKLLRGKSTTGAKNLIYLNPLKVVEITRRGKELYVVLDNGDTYFLESLTEVDITILKGEQDQFVDPLPK